MNSVARALALGALRRREVRDRLQRPAAAVGNENMKAASAAYSTTADWQAAYRCRSDGGYLVVPLVAVGAGTWLIATAATRYVMKLPRQGTTKTTATVVDGPRPEVVAAASAPCPSPTNS